MKGQYLDLDATAMAELVAQREVKPIELVDEAIKRIEAANPKVNAVVWRDFEGAREQARNELPDGLFTGIAFYEANGYAVEEILSMGKELK